MIVRAEECRRHLEDIINIDTDIEALRLPPNDWRQLSDIQKILAPFNEYTEHVSRDRLSIHMATRMFGELRSILLAIKDRRGSSNCFLFPLIMKKLSILLPGFNPIARAENQMAERYERTKKPSGFVGSAEHKI
jgi:hypothetical protein